MAVKFFTYRNGEKVTYKMELPITREQVAGLEAKGVEFGGVASSGLVYQRFGVVGVPLARSGKLFEKACRIKTASETRAAQGDRPKQSE